MNITSIFGLPLKIVGRIRNAAEDRARRQARQMLGRIGEQLEHLGARLKAMSSDETAPDGKSQTKEPRKKTVKSVPTGQPASA